MTYGRQAPDLANASFQGAPTHTPAAFNAANAAWPAAPGVVTVSVRTRTPIGQAVVRLSPQINLWLHAPSPLRQPGVVLAANSFMAITVDSPLRPPRALFTVSQVLTARAPTPLQAARALVFSDFSARIDPNAPVRYVMDLIAPGGDVRVPISSWQATVQTGSNVYAYCVVPLGSSWLAPIAAATAFKISRQSTTRDAAVLEVEMVRASLDSTQSWPGAQNYTVAISGYAPQWEGGAGDAPEFERQLKGVSLINKSSGSTRLRCQIDWLLRPGMFANHGNERFLVAFINYYVQDFAQYMDVGDRQE